MWQLVLDFENDAGKTLLRVIRGFMRKGFIRTDGNPFV
jgi:hypothetical protein